MNKHKKRAVKTISLAVSADIVLGILFGWAQGCGVWNGLYFATVTATTVGYGDVTPRGWLPHLLATMIMVTVVPLVTGTFSLFTTGLTADHIDLRHRQAKQHVTETMEGKHD